MRTDSPEISAAATISFETERNRAFGSTTRDRPVRVANPAVRSTQRARGTESYLKSQGAPARPKDAGYTAPSPEVERGLGCQIDVSSWQF